MCKSFYTCNIWPGLFSIILGSKDTIVWYYHTCFKIYSLIKLFFFCLNLKTFSCLVNYALNYISAALHNAKRFIFHNRFYPFEYFYLICNFYRSGFIIKQSIISSASTKRVSEYYTPEFLNFWFCCDFMFYFPFEFCLPTEL